VPLVGPSLVQRLSGFPGNAEFGDIVKGLPIGEGAADAIYCSHVLEHLWRDDCARALVNTHRHLKPGGLFRLVVPDVSLLARGFLSDDTSESGLRFVDSLQMTSTERPRGVMGFIRYNWGHSQHRWMWELRGLEKFLRAAGFSVIRQAKLGDSELEAFKSVEVPDRYEFSLCIEAQK
jgi:SAM-dependent methyltransferase